MAKERRRAISTEIWFQKYRILRQLGEGGTGGVFLAEHIRLKYLRAIKRIRKSHPAYQRLIQEADILKSLSHPYIPVIYDVEEDAAYSYIVMEYAEGLSLKALCLEKGRIKEKETVLICLQICEVFQVLHSAEQTILYLDLKPDNVIIKDLKIKVVDFGTAKIKDGKKEKISMGTKGFAAPEQYQLNGADEQSDIYGLGSLMLFMATGLSGSKGLKCLEKAEDYSEAFKQTVFQCMKYNKTERFETINQVKECLSALEPEGKRKKDPSGTSVAVAFAGVQPRCGVTHICLMLTEYLCGHGEKAVYVEAGEKRDMERLCRSDGRRNYPVLCGNPYRLREKYREYDIFICDYGVYKEASEDFWKEDCICLVTGARAWELRYWEEAEGEVLKRGLPVYFVVNFTSAKEFFHLVKGKKERCLRMPYREKVLAEDKELAGLLERLLKRSMYAGNIHYRKRTSEKKKRSSENSLSGRCRTWCRSYTYRHFAGRIFRREKRGTDAVFGDEQP